MSKHLLCALALVAACGGNNNTNNTTPPGDISDPLTGCLDYDGYCCCPHRER